MRRFYFLLLFSFTIILARDVNKNSISGFVFDVHNHAPLAFANVYLANTLWGNATDEKGYFKIENIPAGFYDIVVQVVGYRTDIQNFYIKKNQHKKFTFRLKPHTYKTGSIRVEALSTKQWGRELRRFKRLFYGRTEAANQCMIENSEVLDFKNDGNVFSASARKPLIIINNALGYKLNCILVGFLWDKERLLLSWKVQSQFSELIPINEAQKREWQRARNKAYDQSLDGFLAWLVNPEQAPEKYRTSLVRYLPRRMNKKKSSPFNEIPYLSMKPIGHFTDVPPWMVALNKIVTPGEDPGSFVFKFKDYLQVVELKSEQTSYLRMLEKQVTLDAYGISAEPVPFEISGVWADAGIANFLPLYFKRQTK